MLFLYHPLRREKEFSPGFPALYQMELGQGVQDAVNINKIKFGACGYSFDHAYFKFN